MGKIKKILEEKPDVLFHKLKFKVRKKAHKLNDKMLGLESAERITIVRPNEFRTVMCTEELDNASSDLDRILSRSFRWLGMKGLEVTPDTWNVDFISGFKWPNQYFQDIVTVDKTNNAEVKVPWELSRLQHLTRLAVIYRNNGCGEDVVDHIKEDINSWLAYNPVKESINWTCAMEVGIRAINLIFIALLLPDRLFGDDPFYQKYIKVLLEHGYYIMHNLETYDEYYNNHYLSDLLGLQWIGLFCEEHVAEKEKRIARNWYKFARKELDNECSKQIFNDGTDYESSVAYHRFVTELFYLSIFIDKVYGKDVSTSVQKSVEGMTQFLRDVRTPNGKLPLLGDSDDGRFLSPQ